MDKREYIKTIVTQEISKYNTKHLFRLVNAFNLKEILITETNYLEKNCKISERLYHILNDLHTIPKCLNSNCNNYVKFYSFGKGYLSFCCKKCTLDISSKEIIQKKFIETCKKKYGVENPSKLDNIKLKKIETSKNNFGTEYYMQSESGKKQFKKTMNEKYKVNTPLEFKDFQEKYKKTCLDKYGVTNSSKNDTIKKDIKQKLKSIYNDPLKRENILKKMQNTNLQKYGITHPMKNEKYRINIQKKFLKNFIENVFNPSLEKLEIELIEEYVDARFKQNYLCKKCNTIFIQSWFGIQQGFRCPTCFPRNMGYSIAEKEIVNFIEEIIPNKLITNTKKIIFPKELDIFIPSMNIAIEYDGLYYHSDRNENEKNSKYHLNKTIECQKIGIKLIHIFEDEWLFKQDIVKQRLLHIINYKNLQNKIYARDKKIFIKEIDNIQKNKFLEKYHIQGKDISTIKLGAFYNDQLVSVMTFSKGNISKGSYVQEGVWELNRFCSDFSYHIPGIAGKLLAHFKRNYEWKQIFSYADRRWSEGNLYYKLGFHLSGMTQPNYWYVKGNKRIHRFALRKRKEEPKNISEWILRQSEGYIRIWDCGNLKFTMNKGVK